MTIVRFDANGKGTARQLGAEAEQRALDWLIAQGLVLLERNFQSRHGEIDLIMREPRPALASGGTAGTAAGKDKDTLVFVEVRFRSELAWATGRESVDLRKRKRIVACAKFYLLQHPELARLACRFDVLALASGHGSDRHDWIRNAFGDGWW